MVRAECSVGKVGLGLRKFTAQVTVSVAATLCATAIYGHFTSDPMASGTRAGVLATAAPASPLRAEGGVIEARTLAYYPEHLAALASLMQFRPVSAQRTAELAGAVPTRLAATPADPAFARRPAVIALVPPRRPLALAQVEVLPPRRPAFAAPEPVAAPAVAGASAPPIVIADSAPSAPQRAQLWGVELPRFVPTGATMLDKLASMKQTVGGLMHVSSR